MLWKILLFFIHLLQYQRVPLWIRAFARNRAGDFVFFQHAKKLFVPEIRRRIIKIDVMFFSLRPVDNAVEVNMHLFEGIFAEFFLNQRKNVLPFASCVDFSFPRVQMRKINAGLDLFKFRT